MIKMIFEGGYTYYMANSEYRILIGLAGIGSAAIMIGVLALGTFLTRKTIRKFKDKDKA